MRNVNDVNNSAGTIFTVRYLPRQRRIIISGQAHERCQNRRSANEQSSVNRSLNHSLWLKQTVYTVIVVAIVAIVMASIEIVTFYHDEHDRFQAFGNHLVDSISDAAARAAFHVDDRQAQTVVDGLMQYDELESAAITTDLGHVLAGHSQITGESANDRISEWLFSDVTFFERELSVDRSEFVAGRPQSSDYAKTAVGTIEIRANAAAIGRSFVGQLRNRIVDLAVEFLVLAAALGFIFHKTITEPLAGVAEQLSNIDAHKVDLPTLKAPLNHEQDELGRVVARTNDLLAKIGEQQADLVHREKIAALGSMLAEVAHELNNPLAVVTAQAELLAETAPDQATRDRAQKILRPAMRSANIVRKFLSLARQRKIEKTVIDVRRLINESVDMLNYQLANRDIVVSTEFQNGVGRILGDSSQLGQVLINVLMNAQQALSDIEDRREIKIQTFEIPDRESVAISISDNGPGIPESIHPKIFKHFFTTKPEGRGTGLGLSYCRTIVEGHGGSIAVRDVKPRGTEIVIELPGTTQPEEQIGGRAHPAQSMTSLHVLVVEDEVELAMSIAEVLSKHGHSAVTVTSAEDGMEQLDSESFDVILADIHMPGTDGMQFYRNVRAINESLADRFVFVTGDSLDERIVEFLSLERRPYLNKPFELGEMIRVVEHVLLAPKTPPSPSNAFEDRRGV